MWTSKADIVGCAHGFTYIAGRFSLLTKSNEAIEDANQLWNPTCADALDLGFQYENLIKGAAADAVNTVNPKVQSSHNTRTMAHTCAINAASRGSRPARWSPDCVVSSPLTLQAIRRTLAFALYTKIRAIPSEGGSRSLSCMLRASPS